ncbi:MAG: type II toxin-antitoxin system VapC family toxin [Herpetosiphon sp.]|nr:type II toxin-antitoxin system VapC family toxin [Herpetosiphon sp.]
MKYLLDTHSFMWFVEGKHSLSATARNLIANEKSILFLSMASIWEIAIKSSLNKLTLHQPFEVFISNQIRNNALNILEINIQHTIQVTYLPFHHRDPFDRIIIAQSIVESLPIISVDTIFDMYAGVTRIW